VATFELLSAPLLCPRLSISREVSGAWCEAGDRTLGAQGKRVHATVWAGCNGAGARDAGQCRHPDHTDHGYAPVADSAALCGQSGEPV